jgi:hypothetical protein
MKSEDIMMSSPHMEPAGSEPPESEDWTTVILPDRPWFRLDLHEAEQLEAIRVLTHLIKQGKNRNEQIQTRAIRQPQRPPRGQ